MSVISNRKKVLAACTVAVLGAVGGGYVGNELGLFDDLLNPQYRSVPVKSGTAHGATVPGLPTVAKSDDAEDVVFDLSGNDSLSSAAEHEAGGQVVAASISDVLPGAQAAEMPVPAGSGVNEDAADLADPTDAKMELANGADASGAAGLATQAASNSESDATPADSASRGKPEVTTQVATPAAPAVKQPAPRALVKVQNSPTAESKPVAAIAPVVEVAQVASVPSAVRPSEVARPAATVSAADNYQLSAEAALVRDIRILQLQVQQKELREKLNPVADVQPPKLSMPTLSGAATAVGLALPQAATGDEIQLPRLKFVSTWGGADVLGADVILNGVRFTVKPGDEVTDGWVVKIITKNTLVMQRGKRQHIMKLGA